MTRPDVLVSARGLVKHYGKYRALDGVSFAIAAGDTVGLLGPNGAGKTTLLKTLLGFLPYSDGSVDLLGQSLVRAPLQARQRIGYMPENEAAFPELSGLEAVVLAGRLSGMPREAAFSRGHEVLDYLGMDEVRLRPVSGYSIGLKQKIKLAQAVVHGPKLLFLDEPMSGLDPGSREEMMRLLAGIAKSGVAMVLSSHVLHDVESLCRSVLMLNCGRIVYDGALADLNRARRDVLRVRVRGDVARFIRAAHDAGMTAEASAGGSLTLHVPGDGGHVPGDGGKDRAGGWTGAAGTDAVFGAARAAGVEIRELGPERDTLERSFLRLLGRDRPADSEGR